MASRSLRNLIRETEQARDREAAETTLPRMALESDTRASLVRAGKKVRTWTGIRDQLIREAVAEGGSLREVGEAVGLSHTAVKFIAHGRNP